MVSTYTPGTSMFVRSLYGSGALSIPNPDANWYIPPADAQAVGINVLESGLAPDPFGVGCTTANFALSGGGGTWQTNMCGNWHQFFINHYVT